MKRNQIVFVSCGIAELQTVDIGMPTGKNALVRKEYTVIIGGAEKACLNGSAKVQAKLPCSLGY